MKHILGMGVVVVDTVGEIAAYPAPDNKVRQLDGWRQAGGPVPTALRVLGGWGYPVAFAGTVGKDMEGEYIRRRLREDGVACDFLQQDPEQETAHAMVWLDRGTASRTIVYRDGPPPDLDSLLPALADFDHLHLDARYPDEAIALIKASRAAGLTVSLDTGTYRDSTSRLLEHVDCAAMPRHFAEGYFGPGNLQDYARMAGREWPKIRLLAVTDGAEGSACINRAGQDTPEEPLQVHRQTAFPVEARDTCGAGDVHAAGLVHAFLEAMGAADGARFAAAAAACKCELPGNRVLPGLKRVQRMSE